MSSRWPLFLIAALLGSGCASNHTKAPGASADVQSTSCSMNTASPWIEKWFAAWDLASSRILKLPVVPAPEIVFFDSTCVYTTSALSAHGAPTVDGPQFQGQKLAWRAIAHNGSIMRPDSGTSPVQLMSFAGSAKTTGPFFVMAAPSLWAKVGKPGDESPGLPVFLHEFTHTRQMGAFRDRLGPIDSTWSFPEELDDDAVQTHFSADSVYVAAYIAERDLLYQAADAPTTNEARALAMQALAMMRSRHARYFTGDKAVFATLDNIWLAMEGAAQWTAAAWLSHPEGGKMTRDAAVKKMIGRRRWWAQDESLALFLVVDRLMPDWPRYEFTAPAPGALDLLEKAVIQSAPTISPDKMKSVRAAIEKQYRKQRQAYFDQTPDAIQAVRAPDFAAQPPNAPRGTSEDAKGYLKASFQQVKRTLSLSLDIQELAVQGDTAIVTIHQHWKRKQNKGGSLRTVETEAVQREWWRNTPDGWRIFFIDDIHPGVWKVDGKRIDPSKPYDPAAPPYEPDPGVKNGPG